MIIKRDNITIHWMQEVAVVVVVIIRIRACGLQKRFPGAPTQMRL